MKVSITTTKELQNPQLEIHIDLETGKTFITLMSTCQRCAGWGCKRQDIYSGSQCNGGTIHTRLEANKVIPTLGSESKELLSNLFKDILNG